MKPMGRVSTSNSSKKVGSNDNSSDMENFMMFPPLPDDSMIKYYKQEIRVTLHHFYVVNEIGEVKEFLDLINILKTAEEHDTVFIYLNTPGGNLYTAIQIISAMRQSNATVITCLEGEVASAGTLIFLAGHKYVVNPNCTFMIHNYSHWVGGKGNEVAIRVKYSEQYFKELANDLYGKFLTPTELDDVLNGKDIWFSSSEVLARLSKESSSLISDILEGKPADEPGDKPAEVQVIVKEDKPKPVIKKKAKTKKGNSPIKGHSSPCM